MGSNRYGEGGALGEYTGKIKHSNRHPPDILTTSGGVGTARLTARPRESPGSGYNCRKHLTTFELLLNR